MSERILIARDCYGKRGSEKERTTDKAMDTVLWTKSSKQIGTKVFLGTKFPGAHPLKVN